MISDQFGDPPTPDPEAEALAEVEEVLTRIARAVLSPARSDWADMLQEGRIEFWCAYREQGRIPLAMWRAKRRMRMFAHAGRVETGYTGNKGRHGERREPEQVAILDQPVTEDGTITLGDLIAEVESVEGVETAYHHGEIHDALSALTPRQQRYVYARFWCGMDPSGGLHMNPGMRQARANNPDLRRDILWTGSKTMDGAKQRLRDRLEHLQDAEAVR